MIEYIFTIEAEIAFESALSVQNAAHHSLKAANSSSSSQATAEASQTSSALFSDIKDV